MIKKIAAAVLAILFFGLAAIHFYWAGGGKWALANTLPANEEGIKLLKPTTIDCITVGAALLVLSLFYVRSNSLPKRKLWIRIRRVVLWTIPILFILRAIGDFNYLGFFKEIDTTDFAYYDTFLYSPLCLFIGALGLITAKKTD